MDSISGRRFVKPYLDTSTQGSGTLPAEETPTKGTVDARRKSAVDNLIGQVSDPVRERMQEVLSPYPTGELEAMRKHGLKIDIKSGKSGLLGAAGGSGTVALGGYIPVLRKVIFEESVLMSDLGPHMVVHELGHVMDHMRGDRASALGHVPVLKNLRPLMTGPFESEKDPELLRLYNEFNARANVEDIDVMRREIKVENDMKMPDRFKYTTDDGWGLRTVEYERKDGQEIFHVSTSMKQGSKKAGVIRAAVGTALLAGGIAFAGPIVATVGGVILGFSALGLVRKGLEGRHKVTSEVDVEMKTKGATAHVQQTYDDAVVTVPEGARSYTGDVWSDYAHRGAGVFEYAAEAYSTYLEGGDRAAVFQETDPKMYDFVEKRLKEEFDSHP